MTFSIYLIIAIVVFAIRHPWATQIEMTHHLKDVLMYKKLTYTEMRAKYE